MEQQPRHLRTIAYAARLTQRFGRKTLSIGALVLAGLPPQHAGAAAGVLATMQQVANALGVALIGIIFYGVLGTSDQMDGYPQAFAASLMHLVMLGVGVTLLTWFLLRERA